MDENKLVEEINNRIASKLTEMQATMGSYATKDDFHKEIAALRDEAKTAGENKELVSKMDDLQKNFDEVTKQIEARLQRADEPAKQVTLRDALIKNIDNLKEMRGNQQKTLNLRTIVGTSDISTDPSGFFLPDLQEIQRGVATIAPLFSKRSVGANSHGVIRYIDQYAVTSGSAAMSAKGSYPTTSNIDWKGYSLNVEKIGDRIAVTKEMMLDVDFVMSEIRNLLIRNMELKKDYYLINGTGSSPQIYGLKSKAVAYTSGSFANKFKGADLINLISSIATQIRTSVQDGTFAKFKANYAIVNPVIVEALRGARDNENRLLYPQWMLGGDITINGVKIVESAEVTVDEMYVGDFNFGELYTANPLSLELGYAADTNDWEKDQISIKGTWRGAMLIRDVNLNAFRYVSDITTAISEITAVDGSN